jgi:hypothetical protein
MLVLEMFMRHVDETDLSPEKKALFKKAFYKVVGDKIEVWLKYNKDLVDGLGWRRDGMKIVDVNKEI